MGHVPRAVAAKLAPMLDKRLVSIEGVMLEGNSEFFGNIHTLRSNYLSSVTGQKYSLSTQVAFCVIWEGTDTQVFLGQ